VPQRVARERASELAALSEQRWAAFCRTQAGRVLEVAVERVAGGSARGTAREYVTVRWPAGGERRGDLVRVRVTDGDGDVCLGERATSP
jgi:tRNA A37 methylthiotransferase MiaB